MESGRMLFLARVFATHAIVGYALVRGFTDADPRVGIVFGLLPDVDLCFPAEWGWPLVHRAVTHTPLFALAIVAGAYAVTRERTIALAAGLAIGSHLAIDSLSPGGIDWLFPLETTWSPGIAVHGLFATVALWAVSIGILAWRSDVFSQFSTG
ncbi:metal-dependent hydrolase [Natronorubrum sp. FCH18a]|uniref:metal-dependent hydrolase n=1 Tax=Natronorubrum sp. FCH18a TaxID=3447018 RepID=UPI003F5146E7